MDLAGYHPGGRVADGQRAGVAGLPAIAGRRPVHTPLSARNDQTPHRLLRGHARSHREPSRLRSVCSTCGSGHAREEAGNAHAAGLAVAGSDASMGRRTQGAGLARLIPEGAPVIPPQLTPLHDMSQLSNALSAESAPPARQQAPDAPVVKSLDGQQVKLPGYIVPLEVNEEGRTTEFLLVPYYGACIHVPPPPPNQIVHIFSEMGVRVEDSTSPTGSRERCRLELPAASWPTPATRWKPRKSTLMS